MPGVTGGASMIISIDIANNEIFTGAVRSSGRHRWDALFLAALIRRNGEPLRCSELQASLRRHGQVVPLDRTGISRLLAGVTSMLDTMLGAGAARRRITHAPRTRTVGPWAWAVEPAESWALLGDETARAGAPRLPTSAGARGGDSAATDSPAVSPLTDLPPEFGAETQITLTQARGPVLTCLEKLLKSDAMAQAGRLDEAIDLLHEVARLEDLTIEMRCLADLRQITLLRRCGRYDDANDLASAMLLRTKANRTRPNDPGLRCLARISQILSRYGSTPKAYAQIAQDLAGTSIPTAPDIRAASQQQNLWALLIRRHALVALRHGSAGAAAVLLQRAWRHANAAMYWAISQHDHENFQNYAFNMGLVLKSQFDAGDGPALEFAFRCFRLAVQCGDDFLCGNDSVLDFIVLADLWLEHPDQRAVFEQGLEFGQSGPHAQLFYEEGLRRAKALGEARQIAQCAINLWRWGELLEVDEPSAQLRCRARAELLRVLEGNDALLLTLRFDSPAIMDKILGPGVATRPRRVKAGGRPPAANGPRTR